MEIVHVRILISLLQVSRCQAKMSRPLKDEDFTARHKFSFDMLVKLCHSFISLTSCLDAYCTQLIALEMSLLPQRNMISSSKTMHPGSSANFEKTIFISIQQITSYP